MMNENLKEPIDRRRRLVKEIGAELEPIRMDDTPLVIFLGGRAMDEQLRGEREKRHLKIKDNGSSSEEGHHGK